MKFISNTKLAYRLIASFVFISMLAGLIAVIAIYNINRLHESDNTLYYQYTVPIEILGKIKEQFLYGMIDCRDILFAENEAEIDSIEQTIVSRFVAISNAMNELKKYTIDNEEFQDSDKIGEVRNKYNQLESIKSVYSNYFSQVIECARENNDALGFQLLMSSEMKMALDAEILAIDRFTNSIVGYAEEQIQDNGKIAQMGINIMLCSLGATLLLAISFGVLISRSITKSVTKLVSVADSIADGNLDINLEVRSKDELGKLASAFKKMADKLNELLLEINTAADQVAVSSKQLSDVSITISQGATEQASSIEQLTSSIEQIASQTKLNAKNADRANRIANNAKNNAVAGNEHMTSMIQAMNEINDSSNSISKIIKVIDDIAFQTNILALNAAVEAARAGQYGRGFAVVADEVRNLASKSAEAAKETTAMIEGSITKIKQGTQIANETAAALKKIVDGVDSMAIIMSEIARASNEQSQGIEQVNQGVVQVSKVVQANSATSVEGAAASEELYGQAQMMKSQIANFKLRGLNSEADDQNAGKTEDKNRADKNSEKPNAKKKRSLFPRKKIVLTEELGKY